MWQNWNFADRSGGLQNHCSFHHYGDAVLLKKWWMRQWKVKSCKEELRRADPGLYQITSSTWPVVFHFNSYKVIWI